MEALVALQKHSVIKATRIVIVGSATQLRNEINKDVFSAGNNKPPWRSPDACPTASVLITTQTSISIV
ncbi:hypothetical protein QYF36_025120 [Acer negundo]|nr:hypothetical protein QYF36_025120 [Acer negundo]